jgi:aerobic C4-dicarboxylate transport protein
VLGRLRRSLYLQVLLAVALGAAVGRFAPALAVQFKPLGEGFIKLVKMLIGPIIFCTVVGGVAKAGNLKRVGRVGLKALVYFEVVSTLALLLGLLVGELIRPGAGVHADPAKLDAGAVASYVQAGQHLSTVDFILDVIPTTVTSAFAEGKVLQILLLSLLFGTALSAMGESGARVSGLVDEVGHVFFRVVGYLMNLAPLGAFGAIAFTVGQFGLGTLADLAKLMACFYATSAIFVLLVLGGISAWAGAPILALIRYLKDELFIVLATSSSESVLPRMIERLEAAGCSRSVAGLVIPMGYSFNLDGTSIYLTLATLFVAQALGIPLSLRDELGLMAVLILSSKGAAAVTGGGFITLAATLSATGTLPVAGLALLLGVDRFMSEARALTNLVGNGVATLAIARWEGELDADQLRRALSRASPSAMAALPVPGAPP